MNLFLQSHKPKGKIPSARHWKKLYIKIATPLNSSSLAITGHMYLKHFQWAWKRNHLPKYKLIYTSENNLQHQHVTHCSWDGWRKGSIWHVWVVVHIWHHYVPRITRVGRSLVVKASIWMLPWEDSKNKPCIFHITVFFSWESNSSKTDETLHKRFVYKTL